MTRVKRLDWHGLYGERWTNEIVPEAFGHPAKFSRALIRKIYQHMIERGWLCSADSVVDPFGGVGLGALEAMRLGCNWYGCELEEKFVKLGNENIALWDRRYAGQMPHWGTALLVQGDSRELVAVLGRNCKSGGFDAVVSSPPYAKSATGANGSGVDRRKQYETYRASGGGQSFEAFCRTQELHSQNYGTAPGQLGAMPAGTFDAAIGSPPFGDQEPSHAQNDTPSKKRLLAAVAGLGRFIESSYGTSPGQLGTMRAGGLDAAVSSPPYEGIRQDGGPTRGGYGGGMTNYSGEPRVSHHTQRAQQNFGNTPGETFWSAARAIVEQTYLVLKPGGVSAWVVKSFVRNKQIVDFPGQWRKLCEACGFETLEVARAWLVEDAGTTIDLDGQHNHRTKQRKSFFRRLAEAKGSPRIDYEVVLFMRRRDT